MLNRPLHCFHDRELHRQCCNCDRTPAQCLNEGCDGTRWSNWGYFFDPTTAKSIGRAGHDFSP